MTRAALYSRVSTTEQAREGVSLREQRERLELVAKLEEWQIYDYYADEGISGTTDQRPELQRLMSDVRGGRIDLVAVTKLDRFFRNTRLLLNHVHMLEEHRVAFVALADDVDTRKSGIGRVILALLAAVAEWERDRIAERVSDFRQHLASKGRWSSGRTPFGYRFNPDSKELDIYEPESEVVSYIFHVYTTENIGLVRMAEQLNTKHKLPPRPGRRKSELWTDKAVRHILKHPAYKAQWKFRTPMIVEPDTWELAQYRLAHNRHFKPGNHHFDYQGLLKCGLCGHTLRVGYNHNRNPVYECPGRLKRNHLDGSARCTLPRYSIDLLETALTEETEATFNNKDKLIAELKRTLESLEQERKELELRLQPSKKELNEIKRRLEVADTKFEVGRLDRETYKATIAGLNAKLRQLERQQRENNPLELEDWTLLNEQIRFMSRIVEVGLDGYGRELAEKFCETEEARDAFIQSWPDGLSLINRHPRELIERLGMVAFVYPEEVRLQGKTMLGQSNTSSAYRSGRYPQSR